MKIDAAKNNIDYEAWLDRSATRVRIRIGWQRYTALPHEAVRLAEQLLAAAKEARGEVDD